MAKQTSCELWIGEDHEYVFSVLNADESIAIDIGGWALSWMLKRKLSDPDLAKLLEKTTVAGIVISGTFNSLPTLNTQVATVSLFDTDSDTLKQGVCQYELKRTDAGSEAPLAYGPNNLRRGVHRS